MLHWAWKTPISQRLSKWGPRPATAPPENKLGMQFLDSPPRLGEKTQQPAVLTRLLGESKSHLFLLKQFSHLCCYSDTPSGDGRWRRFSLPSSCPQPGLSNYSPNRSGCLVGSDSHSKPYCCRWIHAWCKKKILRTLRKFNSHSPNTHSLLYIFLDISEHK